MALDRALEPDLHADPVAMSTRRPDLPTLEVRLDYRFADRKHLTEALTHVSRTGGGPTYQRFEFLGDRVLGLAVADILLTAFPAASEGDLSRRLAELVRRETCAEVGEAWGLGPLLLLGPGGGNAAMRRNPSILADACEAVFGAVFVDGGFEAARDLVRRSFEPRLAGLVEVPANPKTVLQEWAAALGKPPPIYVIVGRSGPDHAPRFAIAARVEGLDEAIGSGRSRRAAEQAAAQAVLVREGVRTPAPSPGTGASIPDDAHV